MKSWKAFEKEVAETFGGARRVRVSYSEKAGDIVHSTLAIECKYGKQVPKYLDIKEPVVYKSESGTYLCAPASYLVKGQHDGLIPVIELKSTEFISDGLDQAEGYHDAKGKLPMLCVKRPRMRGFVCVIEVED